jgi:hypothetical protein
VQRLRWLAPGALLVAALALSGCGGSSSASPKSPSNARSATSTSAAPQPAGANPSASAKMVCAHEAQADIAGTLGVKPTAVTTPTWANHLYSCQYVYPNGVVTLSVKELPDADTTTSWFDGLAATLGRQPTDLPIGQGAFIATNGSVVVRKDYKVLEVDVSKLPATFGSLKLKPQDVATAVAEVVLGCWSGN